MKSHPPICAKLCVGNSWEFKLTSSIFMFHNLLTKESAPNLLAFAGYPQCQRNPKFPISKELNNLHGQSTGTEHGWLLKCAVLISQVQFSSPDLIWSRGRVIERKFLATHPGIVQ